MMPGSYALNIYRGDDHFWRFVLWEDAAKTQAIDLTAITVKAELRDRTGGALVVPALIAVTLPNTIDMTLDHDATRIAPASGRWDLQLTDMGGQVATVLAGPVNVTGDITDSGTTPIGRRAGHMLEATR